MQPNKQQQSDSPQLEQNKQVQVQESPQHPQDQQQQQITAQTVQSFNRVCQNAALLMQSYKQQSCALKQQISSMVSIYQKSSSSTTQSIPVDKIIQITKEYEIGMRQANSQYNVLNEELRKEEKQRDQMMKQIQNMFGKLEKMEVKLKEKKMKQLQKKRIEQIHQEQVENKINQLNLKEEENKQQ